MDIKLRSYQERVIERIRQSYASGKRAPCLVMPTGAGKTLCFSFIAAQAQAKRNRVLILTHRTELMRQSSSTLAKFDLSHGLIAPGRFGHLEPVAVASAQTLVNRLKKSSLEYDLVIIDEAHLYAAPSFKSVLTQLSRAKFLAVTATPIRLDGKGLNEFCDDLIEGPSIQELIAQGYLVRPETYAPPMRFSLDGVAKRNGDYVTSELSSRVDKPSITGSAVEHYAKLAPGEPAIVFCVSVEHSENVAEQFRARGFTSEAIHSKSKDREGIIKRVRERKTQVLTSVDILTTGTDIPELSVAICLRPTQSLALHIQSLGRVLRTSPGKSRALILDHAGNSLKHGLVDDLREWSLEGARKRQRPKDQAITLRTCKKCFAVWETAARACPYCGHTNVSEPRRIEEREGELKLLKRQEKEAKKLETQTLMREMKQASTYEEALTIAEKYGKHPNWVDYRWGRKFHR